MMKYKTGWVILGMVICLSFTGVAAGGWAYPAPYPALDSAIWFFDNTTETDVTGLRIEFDQEVTITYSIALGGDMLLYGEATNTVFDFVGTLIPYGNLTLHFEPVNALPTYIIWLYGERAVGTPIFTTVDKLGYLLGVGIVHLRETDPDALAAVFAQFFADNAAFLEGLSQSLGMSLADSLMPIIMTSPAEGIENFFSTILGMLGVTTLDSVLQGDLNWSALLSMLGL